MPDDPVDTAAPSGPTAPEPEAPSSEAPGGSDEPMADPARDMVPRAELEKVIRERQAAKQRARKAESELASLAALPSSSTADPDSSEPAETLQRKLRLRETQLAALLRDQQLRQAAARAGAINPDQVVGILRPRVVMAEGDDGELCPVFLDEAGRVELAEDGSAPDADAFVGRFLADPAQANLLRSSSVPGSGARPVGGTAPAEAVPQTLAEFNALPASRRRDAAMRMSRRQREAMLGIARPGADGYL